METNAFILGVSAFVVILLIMAFKVNDEHRFLKFLLFLLAPLFLLFIPKILLDEADHCQVVPVNATVSGSTTTYAYERFCETNTQGTATSFYTRSLWMFRFFIMYFFVYIIWFLFTKVFAVENYKIVRRRR